MLTWGSSLPVRGSQGLWGCQEASSLPLPRDIGTQGHIWSGFQERGLPLPGRLTVALGRDGGAWRTLRQAGGPSSGWRNVSVSEQNWLDPSLPNLSTALCPAPSAACISDPGNFTDRILGCAFLKPRQLGVWTGMACAV